MLFGAVWLLFCECLLFAAMSLFFSAWFPSTVATSTLQALQGAPYAIVTGSRNEAFVVPVGPALHIDIPLDPAASGLFLTKTASKTGAAIVGERK